MFNFGNHLRDLRKSNRITQKQIAGALHITERNYQNLEAGISKPSYDTLVALADYFGVSLDYLTGRVDSSCGRFTETKEKEEEDS